MRGRGEQARGWRRAPADLLACGVTMGIVVNEDGMTRYICLECGFSDETTR